jgi:N-acetyl sugar amidotransferase
MLPDYQECTFCVMDTTDPEIVFDAEGRCHHCRNFAKEAATTWFPNAMGVAKLDEILTKIKKAGEGQEFDSILGLSGGVDSSYLALKAKDWGLRPLVVHVDAGWNSELAVQNIEQIVTHTGFELHTHVVDWVDMRRLQLAYLRSGVANQDVPQDHAFFAGLYHFAVKNKVRYVLNGGNIATEGIFPSSWHGAAMDARNLKAINRQFGDGKLSQYPTIGMFRYFVWYPFVRRMVPVRPLNYMDYSMDLAVKELEDRAGWRAYERKHGESLFTKFFQNYYLPTRFGFDKRRPHLSSLIAAGSLTRSEAKAKLEEPLYEPAELERDLDYVCRKLRLSREQLAELLLVPKRKHTEFPNWERRYAALSRARSLATRVSGQNVRIYSR